MKLKNTLRALITVILVISILTSLSACEGEDQKYESELYAMNTLVDLTFYGSDETAAVSAELNRLEALFSVTRENSDIGRLNSSQGKAIAVNKETIEVLNIAKGIYNETDNTFDPTIYPVVRLWGFTTDDFKVPTEEEIEAALKLVDFSKVEISADTVTLPQGAMLDLGAIAKGYAGKMCRDVLKENGVESAVLSIGGNVQTVGENPKDDYWKIALRNPDGGQYLCNILVGETAVVTSGGYERYFEIDGKRYHHIIDPSTGRPANSEFKSVTVVAEDGAVADALSTAFYVGGLELVKNYLAEHPEIGVIIYTVDDNLLISDNMSGYVELSGAVKEAELI